MSTVPKLHDDYLTGIQLLPEKQCRLTIDHRDGGTSQVLLSGVQELRVDDFWGGNIIFELEIADPARIDEKYVRDVLGYKQLISPDYVAKRFESLKSGELILVIISPSYGCYLRCLCTKCELESSAE